MAGFLIIFCPVLGEHLGVHGLFFSVVLNAQMLPDSSIRNKRCVLFTAGATPTGTSSSPTQTKAARLIPTSAPMAPRYQ